MCFGIRLQRTTALACAVDILHILYEIRTANAEEWSR